MKSQNWTKKESRLIKVISEIISRTDLNFYKTVFPSRDSTANIIIIGKKLANYWHFTIKKIKKSIRSILVISTVFVTILVGATSAHAVGLPIPQNNPSINRLARYEKHLIKKPSDSTPLVLSDQMLRLVLHPQFRYYHRLQ